jgi:hypothetical protein
MSVPRAALGWTVLLQSFILTPEGAARLSAASTGSLANFAALPLPWLFIALLPFQLPENPVTKHEALEGAERRFDPAVVHHDLEGTTLRAVPTRLPLLITPAIL